jgi:F-type H+-transporting ATPase subunit b
MAILTLISSAAIFVAAETAAHGGEAAHKTGLPQLAVETFAGQLFWLAIAFVVLYMLLATVAIPKIRGVLEARQGKIAGDLAQAGALKAQADAALKAYEKDVADARARARALADETRAQMKAESDAKRHDAEAKLATDIQAAEAKITDLKTAALANVKTVAAESAADIVTRLSGETITAGEAEAAVVAAMGR